MSRILVAVYESVYVANKAVVELLDLGFSRNKIYLRPGQVNVLQLEKRQRVRNEMVMDELQAGLGIGAGVGGAVGLAGAILAALGELSFPILSYITNGTPALGSEVAAITATGILAGGILGSMISVLIGLGIPEDEIQRYAKNVNRENVSLVVMPDWGDVDGTIEVLERYDPLEIQQKSIEQKKAGEKGKQRLEQGQKVEIGEHNHPQ